jgi:phospholipid/cholesterol/gamma-HCH transport system substrate-binding protein
MPSRNLGEIAAGTVVLVVAIGFLGYAVAGSGRSSLGGYPLTAQFDHIDGLTLGSDVRIAGVKVGAVTGERIDPKTYEAVVTLQVRDGLELPKDTSAEVTSDGLLGGKYLSLSPGADAAMLQPGQAITITQGSVSLEQLLGKFIFSVTNMVDATKAKPGPDQSPNPVKPGSK